MPERSAVSTLRHRSDFDRVFRSGRRRQIGGIVTIVADNPDGATRYGLVAGRRIGGAVERNRVKRRIRHALAAIEVPQGKDLVVIGSPAVLTAQFGELKRWLSAAFASEPQEDHQEKSAQ